MTSVVGSTNAAGAGAPPRGASLWAEAQKEQADAKYATGKAGRSFWRLSQNDTVIPSYLFVLLLGIRRCAHSGFLLLGKDAP